MVCLVDVSDIFYFFFLLGEGAGGARGAGGGGGRFFMENPRSGRSPGWVGAGVRGARRVFVGNCGGGGAKYFFRGRNVHRVWKTRERIRKTIRNVSKHFKPLSRHLKMSHRHFSKSFSSPKISTKRVCFFLFCEVVSEKLEKAVTANFKKHPPHGRLGQSPGQCRPKLGKCVVYSWSLFAYSWASLLTVRSGAYSMHLPLWAQSSSFQFVPKCTVCRRWFVVEFCESFPRSNCTQRFLLGNGSRFLCSNGTVALAMHFATKNGQFCFSLRKFLAISPAILRAARVQNETAPEKFSNRYEKRFEKREKRIRKTIRNAIEKCLAPLRPTKNFSPPIFHQILKVFHRPKFAQEKVFFHREALQGGPR